MIKQILKQNHSVIREVCKKNGIEMLVLFGSCVSGSCHPNSDMDLAAKLERGKSLSKLHLILELASIFENRMIDLALITETTDPLLLFQIYAHGECLYESVKGLFDKERLKAWHLYLDTIPLRRLEAAYNAEKMRELSHVI